MGAINCLECGNVFDHCGCPGVPKVCPECLRNKSTSVQSEPNAQCGKSFNDLLKIRDKVLIAKSSGSFDKIGITQAQSNIMLGLIFSAINLNKPCMAGLDGVFDKVNQLN